MPQVTPRLDPVESSPTGVKSQYLPGAEDGDFLEEQLLSRSGKTIVPSLAAVLFTRGGCKPVKSESESAASR